MTTLAELQRKILEVYTQNGKGIVDFSRDLRSIINKGFSRDRALINLALQNDIEIEEWAHTIFEKGVEPFKSDFGIGNFYHVETEFWVPGVMPLHDELFMAQNTFNWPDAYPAHYDCMVIMSGNIDGNTVGYGERLGDAMIISVKAAFLLMPVWHVFQHEASHL
jgi:hypothetical protein